MNTNKKDTNQATSMSPEKINGMRITLHGRQNSIGSTFLNSSNTNQKGSNYNQSSALMRDT